MENSKIKLIDKNAIINLPVSSGMIEKLQETVTYFAKDLTEEQLNQYAKELPDYIAISKKEKNFSEPWMYAMTTLTFLLKDIEKQADLQGYSKEVDAQAYIKAFAPIEEDIQPDPQSQSQPE
jgi:hypothetical protein